MLRLWRNTRGVTVIEYSLIAAVISVAALGAMEAIGTSLQATFNLIAGKL